jgi:hypothetical protein
VPSLLPLDRNSPQATFANMQLTNDCYVIFIKSQTATERYFRDEDGWCKISTRRRKFRATAEQVLNHLLPALAGVKPNLTVEVKHTPTASRIKSAGARTHSKPRSAAR